MSLIDGDNFKTLTTISASYAFRDLFNSSRYSSISTNSQFILKKSRKNIVLPDSDISEFNKDTYLDDMLKFYADNELYISKNEFECEKFFALNKKLLMFFLKTYKINFKGLIFYIIYFLFFFRKIY